jgi:hypothetical protein
MTDENFLDRLRDDAARLRYDADDVTLTRLAARVRARVAAQPTVTTFLARWFRPVAACSGTSARSSSPPRSRRP